MVENERGRLIRDLLKERILVLDGAMGTVIQNYGLKADDFGGPALDGCNENLVLTRPDVVSAIHRGYVEAGADILETNTFGANRIVLSEYGLQDKTPELNKAAAALAREALEQSASCRRPIFIAGSMGPTNKSLSVTGGVSFDELSGAYEEQAFGLLEGGVDFLLFETVQDPLNLKAGLAACDRAFERFGLTVPIMVSATLEATGTTLAGQGVEALAITLGHRDLLALGLNCSTGPELMTDPIRTLSETVPFPVSCMPNAGLPDENGRYLESPEAFAAKMSRFVEKGWLNLMGGCCGTTREHIRFLSRLAEGKRPRVPTRSRRFAVSGLEPCVPDPERRPVLVGERANAIGSRIFRELIASERFEEAAETGRRQVRSGAQVLDVCLANPDRDEKADMVRFLGQVTKKVKVPLMIDSTDVRVIEEALRLCPGKAIINSINLEDGEKRFEEVARLVHRYGAAVVVGTIDEDKEQGMALTAERKLAIARRSCGLLTGKLGLGPQDILFDPLVFPVGTGDKKYLGSAQETLEGLRLIKSVFPECKTLLGISNVSFGLPPAGREVLNAVFLHHCVQAGLDFAIVNVEKLARYAAIPEGEKRLAEDLLFRKGPGGAGRDAGHDPEAAFIDHFRGAAAAPKTSARPELPARELLVRSVVEGSREGLAETLESLLQTMKPLEIVNGPLLKGMEEVGRLFAANELIVTEVLQSAEVMKAAVTLLEPRMEKEDRTYRAKILLATVKGDVHDIGKNLVHIILKNNGYEVVDLGIKVSPETLIEAIHRERPAVVGLSGLLVKSVQQMAATAEDMGNAGIRIPLLVGGAALTPRFTASRIAPAYQGTVVYAKDAMQGLDSANQLTDPARKEVFLAHHRAQQAAFSETAPAAPKNGNTAPAKPVHKHDIPVPPDLQQHIVDSFPLEEVFRYINPAMLYGKHLGLKGNLENLLQEGDARAEGLASKVEELKQKILREGWMRARAVYRFFPAQSDGNKVFLHESMEGGRALATFEFPRQPDGERLCLSDFVLPGPSGMDVLAVFVVTCGQGVRERSSRLLEEGRYFESHALQALAIGSAEAFAELLHEKIRALWGIADPPGMTLGEKFQARYRGLRASFGYPACPDLEDQKTVFDLLKPESIGVRLTEGYMMDPEASVSALIFHHPEARHFSAR